jgi:phosphatidylserine/phosphatidylglycerophosphate/cardiolipin synthase-like enzyme
MSYAGSARTSSTGSASRQAELPASRDQARWSPAQPGTGRLRATAAVLVGVALVLGAGPAGAATPHMDRVEAALREVAPNLEGIAYERTHNNKLVGYNGRADSWILQTPDCWGQRTCRRPVGIPRFLETIEGDLAKARKLVDLTTMIPFPFGKLYRAIVRGLRRAYRAGNRPMIRVLGGCDPPCALSPGLPSAQAYADQLSAAIKGNPTVIVASYRYPPIATPEDLPSLSWNHSKTIAIDDRVALVGGHNLWSTDYIQGYPEAPVTNPVHDVTIRVEGPVTAAVHRWANTLWRAACADAPATASGAANGANVAYSAGTPRTCPANVRAPKSPRKGIVDVLGFGRLGLLGVRAPSAPSPGSIGPGDPDDPAPCPSGLPWYAPGAESPDWTNDLASMPAYDPRNPADTGLRTLIASARSSVFIAQQDLHGICNPPQPGVTPRFDRRLLDALAGRLLAGVDVRVVISTPGAAVNAEESYSNTSSLSQTSEAVLARTRAAAHDVARAERAFKDHFRLAAIRFSDSPVWPTAPQRFNKIANHAKLGMIDTCAIWIGSHNLYPFWLSEYSLLIENRRAARTFKRQYADPLWSHSAGRGPLPGRPCARRPRT